MDDIYISLRKVIKALILDRYPIIKDYKIIGYGGYGGFTNIKYFVDEDYLVNLMRNSPNTEGYFTIIYNDPLLSEIRNLTFSLHKMLGVEYNLSSIEFFPEEDLY